MQGGDYETMLTEEEIKRAEHVVSCCERMKGSLANDAGLFLSKTTDSCLLWRRAAVTSFLPLEKIAN